MEPAEDEEEEERHSRGHHIARKLNFNAPLLTTRRPACNAAGAMKVSGSCRKVTSSSCEDRVPFSWEKAPGKPKEFVDRSDTAGGDGATTPRPTLPPSWWRPPVRTGTTNLHGRSRHLHRHHNHLTSNENDDGVVGEDNGEDSSCGYVLSVDDEDVFSLSEAIDIVEKAEKDHKFSDELKLKQLKYEEEQEEERRKNYTQSSNFMIERFLPDATALAAASALNLHDYSCSYRNRSCGSPQTAARQPFSPPKGCGLDVLFPWRTKHQLCGVKSPVRHGSVSLGSKSSAKQKKHH